MARVLGIWLDGFEVSLADAWELPNLAALQERAAVAVLDNGTAHLTGLTGEHLVTGLDPVAANRASAMRFDPVHYRCVQEGAMVPPVLGGTRTVVLDACYFELAEAAPEVLGLTDLGAHDPGAPPCSRPAGLTAETLERFGAYPARPWLYGIPWPSPPLCEQMGRDLTAAVELRSRVARWLLAERLPDWDLAFVGVSEAHSASEGLFHGADPDHPLAGQPSAVAAGKGLRSVYAAVDQLVGDLVEAFPDAVVVAFSMHGMGPNRSDVPSMALLGELMARWSGIPTPDAAFPLDDQLVPQLAGDANWSGAVTYALGALDRPPVEDTDDRSFARRAAGRLPGTVRRPLARVARRAGLLPAAVPEVRPVPGPDPTGLAWMPVARHQPHWHEMRAFAIPSYYDGRVRVNVRGREAGGMVDPSQYHALLDEIEALLLACREPRTGAPVVEELHRPVDDPLRLDPTDADLVIGWADDVLGLTHPDLGRIGPLPVRRTGGHTSPFGRCLVAGPGIEAADLGTHSSFDVLPTLLHLAGAEPLHEVTGRPLPITVPTGGV